MADRSRSCVVTVVDEVQSDARKRHEGLHVPDARSIFEDNASDLTDAIFTDFEQVRNIAIDSFDEMADRIDDMVSFLFLNGELPKNATIKRRKEELRESSVFTKLSSYDDEVSLPANFWSRDEMDNYIDDDDFSIFSEYFPTKKSSDTKHHDDPVNRSTETAITEAETTFTEEIDAQSSAFPFSADSSFPSDFFTASVAASHLSGADDESNLLELDSVVETLLPSDFWSTGSPPTKVMDYSAMSASTNKSAEDPANEATSKKSKFLFTDMENESYLIDIDGNGKFTSVCFDSGDGNGDRSDREVSESLTKTVEKPQTKRKMMTMKMFRNNRKKDKKNKDISGSNKTWLLINGESQ